MAKVLQNIFNPGVDEVAQTYIIESWHVSQSVDAFTAATDYDISVSGSITLVGQMQQGDGTSVASGSFSHTEGQATLTMGDYSHAEGNSNVAGALGYACDSTIVAGVFSLKTLYGDVTSEFPNSTPIIFLGNDVFGLQYVDSSTFVGGATEITLQDTGINSSDTKYELVIPGVPIPLSADTILGSDSHAEGFYTTTYGNASHAEGSGTFAIGVSSHTEGEATQAIGDSSHTEGIGTIATGTYSHAEGFFTSASGWYSHAEGFYTKAIGLNSHAEGANTTASGDYSHAEGLGTIASGSYQHVSGKYNKQGDDTSLFIVGNGTANLNRKDAFKVTHSSSIAIPTTQSIAPAWTGTDGEIVPATVGGVYRLYMWMNGAWRSSSFA